MCPWGGRVSWTDEKGKMQYAEAKPGTPFFEAYWGSFLEDFAKHLKEKGWFANTYIAMDERDPEDLKIIAAEKLRILRETGYLDRQKYAELKKMFLAKSVGLGDLRNRVNQLANPWAAKPQGFDRAGHSMIFRKAVISSMAVSAVFAVRMLPKVKEILARPSLRPQRHLGGLRNSIETRRAFSSVRARFTRQR